ncbi:MAG TPA: hypothetical protein DHN33_10890 [Eubacteriaceae bacterium]|nr:hypothetical protein [Eubacteriaceae bacterium]
MNKVKDTQRETVKLIAALAMAVDHVGAVFFPQQIVWRVIGRLAMPIFAMEVARGYRSTGNLKRYQGRMLFFALVTVVPFAFFSMILSNPWHQNILFTFFFALLALEAIEKKKWFNLIVFVAAPVFILSFLGIEMDYGIYGILTVILFARKEKDPRLASYFLLLTLGYLFMESLRLGFPPIQIFGHIQLLSIFAVFVIQSRIDFKLVLPKYFFYLFYPLHIATIVIIYYAM